MILLVDSDHALRTNLAATLTAIGHHVLVADHFADGLRVATKSRPDTIVVDHARGLQLGHLMAEVKKYLPDTQVIILSRRPSIAMAVRAIKLGAHDYLVMPATIGMLVHVICDHGQMASPMGEGHLTTPMGTLKHDYIQHVFKNSDGCISLCARHLGVSRRTLQRRLNHRAA